jgi:hypothetical protein
MVTFLFECHCDEAICLARAEIAHLHCTERSEVQVSQKPLAMTFNLGLGYNRNT